MDNHTGVLYYNTGEKMAVRLAVSIHSLRKHYSGPIAILSEGELSHGFCHKICERYDCAFVKTVFDGTDGKNTTYLNACLAWRHTPYDITCWIDSDTIIQGDISALFRGAMSKDFAIAKFSDWRTNKGRIYGRIQAWRGIMPDHWIQRAIQFGPAINCGVFAWSKRSKLVRDWWGLARQGQHTMIPDEVCCQIMLAQPEYSNTILSQRYNCSCKYGEQWGDDAVIIHYHGRKHCRFGENGKPLYMADKWYPLYDEIRELDFVKKYTPKDRMLRKYLGKWDEMKKRCTD